MADGLSLEEWKAAYREDSEKVRRQVQTMLKLYKHTGEEDKLQAVKDLWINLIAGDLEDIDGNVKEGGEK